MDRPEGWLASHDHDGDVAAPKNPRERAAKRPLVPLAAKRGWNVLTWRHSSAAVARHSLQPARVCPPTPARAGKHRLTDGVPFVTGGRFVLP
jgi:hypothetical protein